MEEQSDDKRESWERNRLKTYIIYNLEYFFSSFSESILYATLWLYVKECTPERYWSLYYGIIFSSIYLPAVLFPNLVSFFADKYRRIKVIMIIANFLAMFGCVCFMFPFHPVMLVLGGFFTGFTFLLRPLMVGELARSYPKKKLLKRLQFFQYTYAIGKPLGPLFVALCTNVDFKVGFLHIRYTNVFALVSLCMAVMLQLLLILFGYDLSRAYDLKQELINKAEGPNQLEEAGPFQLIKKAFKDVDVILIMVFTFIQSFVINLVFVITPVIVLDKLHYSKTTIDIIFAFQLVAFLIYFVLFLKLKVNEFYYGFVSWLMPFVFMTMLIALRRSFGYIPNVVLLTLILSFVELFNITTKVFLSVSLANIVQPKYQSFFDSIRTQILYIGAFAEALFSSTAVAYLNIVCGVIMGVSAICLALTLARRKSFKNEQTRI